jgi:hypothetical protein
LSYVLLVISMVLVFVAPSYHQRWVHAELHKPDRVARSVRHPCVGGGRMRTGGDDAGRVFCR